MSMHKRTKVEGAALLAIPVAARFEEEDPALVAANDRIREDLGWLPEIGLDRIVADAWEFMEAAR